MSNARLFCIGFMVGVSFVRLVTIIPGAHEFGVLVDAVFATHIGIVIGATAVAVWGDRK